MKPRWIMLVLLSSFTLGRQAEGQVAPGLLDRTELTQKLEDQKRAREMTRSLLESVLNLQLRQLEENGLVDLPVYRDIRLMRDHLQEIVDQEMPKVVELLAAVQSAPAEQREAKFIEARQLIRSVVMRLSTERQSLLRRIKSAELVEQVDRLIRLQRDAQERTIQLGETAQARQPAALLKTQDAQQEVQDFYRHLVDSLEDVRNWGGPVSVTASDGLRLLKAADVVRHLEGVKEQLAASNWPSAVDHQQQVRQSLTELITLLQASRGLGATDQQKQIEVFQQLAERQRELRAQVQELPADATAPTELVEQQMALEKELGTLREQLAAEPTAAGFMDRALLASRSAAEDLFEAQNADAIEQQTSVMQHLAAAEELLGRQTGRSQQDRSAAELARQLEHLKQAKSQLEQVATSEMFSASPRPTETMRSLVEMKRMAAEVNALANRNELPETVVEPLKEIANQMLESAKTLEGDSAQTAVLPAETSTALQESLTHVAGAIDAEIQQVQTRASAVAIGELARAADILERTASEERGLVSQLTEAAQQPTPDLIGSFSETQKEIREILNKVAEGLKETTAPLAEKVRVAQSAVERSHASLTQAAAGNEVAQAIQESRREAERTGELLSQVARELRDTIHGEASRLADQNRQRRAQVEAVHQQVEQFPSSRTQVLAEQMMNLHQSRQRILEAQALQQQAMGRTVIAQSMDLQRQLEQVQYAQQEATRLADDLAAGNVSTPLKATTAQQGVADQVARLLAQWEESRAVLPKDAPSNSLWNAAADSLKTVATAASEASRALHRGKTDQSFMEQKSIDEALQQTADHLHAVVKAEQTSPVSTAPDQSAQQEAHAATEQAIRLAPPELTSVTTALAQARKATGQALEELAKGEKESAASAQNQAAQSLEEARQELDSATTELEKQQQEALDEQQAATRQTMTDVALLDASAAATLARSLQTAKLAANTGSSPETRRAAIEKAEEQRERANALLQAHEEDLKRTESVARTLAHLTARQQQAADTLNELRQAMQDDKPGEKTLEQAEAAAKAATAFAESQTATGQGATELSGQEQVANRALREALERTNALFMARLSKSAAMPAAATPSPAETPLVPAEEMPPQNTAATTAEKQTSTTGENSGQTSSPKSQSASAPASAPDTRFVPQNPQLTAEMMAGRKLAEAMQQALEQQQNGNPNASATPQNASGNAQAKPLETNSTAQSSTETNSSRGNQMQAGRNAGAQTENEGMKDGAMQRQPEGTDLGQSSNGRRQSDAQEGARTFQEEPWFAKLPPELRKSMRAGVQQKGPRSYEDRLRKYFQSVD